VTQSRRRESRPFRNPLTHPIFRFIFQLSFDWILRIIQNKHKALCNCRYYNFSAEQVKRNSERFPEDFMFQLSTDEFEYLKSHFATSSSGWGGPRKRPFAFTEHGAIMAASVLNTTKAIEVSVYVVRAFVRIREYLATHKQLVHKLTELERKIEIHDEEIRTLINTIRRLMEPQKTKRRRIGFLSLNSES
jgi:ORF6N domain